MRASKHREVQFTAKCWECGHRFPLKVLVIVETATGRRPACFNCRQLWLLATRKLEMNPRDA